ncbi:MAG: 4-hydroxy-tetrahydrodipicolinate reductase [Pseudomonadota bacterium]|nr:MAG: 4-hydroxy-tetrahydrodipicolinate reductase [Pseudomonadota bacterium]
MIKLALFGATGRMGLAIARLARAADDLSIVGAVCASTDPLLGRDLGELAGGGPLGVVTSADTASGLLGADVVIDFSRADAAPGLFAAAAQKRVAIVSGTTGLDDAGRRALDRAAEVVPVLWAPNMSLGVQVLAELVEQAVRRLGPGFDVEIVEVHHKNKVDAPSGTARRLAEAAARARPELTELHGRSGEVGARKAEQMGVLAVRGGDVVGDHTVYLLGAGERIELVHRATNRDVFAHGALRAARFIHGRSPGRYTIADVLGA